MSELGFVDEIAKVNAGFNKITEDFSEYSGAINMACRTYATAKVRGISTDDELRGMLTIIGILVRVYLGDMMSSVPMGVTHRLTDHWVEWVRTHDA